MEEVKCEPGDCMMSGQEAEDQVFIKEEVDSEIEEDLKPLVDVDVLIQLKTEPQEAKNTEEQLLQEERLVGCSKTEENGVSDRRITDQAMKCDVCGVVLHDQIHFIKHMTTEHLSHLNKSNETVAAKSVVNRPRWQRRPIFCDTCNKSFRDKFHLKNHLRTHTGERPFACNACDASFSHKGLLSKHMLSHNVERPFTCTECGKTFKRRYDVNMHMISHTGEKRFACEVCRKPFTYKKSLEVHMRTHTGERNICNVCNKSYFGKYSLKKHMESHTVGIVLHQ